MMMRILVAYCTVYNMYYTFKTKIKRINQNDSKHTVPNIISVLSIKDINDPEEKTKDDTKEAFVSANG